MPERVVGQHHQSLRLDGTMSSEQHATTEMVLLDPRNTVIGRLRFRTCDDCRTGLILDVWILDTWHRHGLGRELVYALLAHRPGFGWSTTRQTRPGQPFFTAMTEETSVPFPQRGPLCVHLTVRFTRAWRHLISRCRPASADGTTHLP